MPRLVWKGTNYPATSRYASAASSIQSVVRRRQKRTSAKNYKLAPLADKIVDRKIDAKETSHHTGYWFRRRQFSNRPQDDVTWRINKIMPEIVDGTTRGNRVGAQIHLTRLRIQGRFDIPATDNPAVGNGDRANILVRMLVLSSHQYKDLDDIRTNWNAGANLNSLVFKPGATGVPPSGFSVDQLYPVNREAFTVHYDKTFSLNRFYNQGATGLSDTVQKPVEHKFNINMKVKNKLVKYASSTANQAENYCPFMIYMFSYGNGAQPSSTTEVPYCEYRTDLTYKPI